MDKVPETFSFMFPDEGLVWERDMSREQLLIVIRYLMDERDHLFERSQYYLKSFPSH